MSDADNGGGYVRAQVGGIWEISVPSFQFYCKPKTALRKLSFLKTKKTKKTKT